MRVLVIHNFYDSNRNSGENNVVRNEIKLLSEAGHDVTLFSRQNEPDKKIHPVEKAKIGLKFLSGQGSREEFREFLTNKHFEVCHIHNVFPLIGTDFLLDIYEAGIPIVQTLHNYRYRCGSGVNFRRGRLCFDCSNRLGSLPLIAHGCYRESFAESFGMFFAQREYVQRMKQISRFIVLSSFSKESLLQFGIPGDRIRLKPNFVFRSPTDGIVKSKSIIYAGRLEITKGVPELLRAWSQSTASENGWTMKIAGSGPLSPEVQEFAKAEPNVSFLGHLGREKLFEEIKISRFSIVVSQSLESLPMAILESLSVGTPLISSVNPSFQDIIEEQFAVMLSRDVNYWYLTFDKLDSLNYELMSQKAIQEYEKKYSPESSLSALETIYSEVSFLQ